MSFETATRSTTGWQPHERREASRPGPQYSDAEWHDPAGWMLLSYGCIDVRAERADSVALGYLGAPPIGVSRTPLIAMDTTVGRSYLSDISCCNPGPVTTPICVRGRRSRRSNTVTLGLPSARP